MSYVMKSSRASSLLADSRRGNRAGRGVPFIALIPSTMEDKYDINENACILFVRVILQLQKVLLYSRRRRSLFFRSSIPPHRFFAVS